MKSLHFFLFVVSLLALNLQVQAMEEDHAVSKIEYDVNLADQGIHHRNLSFAEILDDIKQKQLEFVRLVIKNGKTKGAAHCIKSFNLDVSKPIIEVSPFANIKQIRTYLLSWAAYYENLDAVKLLIEKGANLNQKDYEGNTALHEIARSTSFSSIPEKQKSKEAELAIASLLIEKGAQVSIENNEGFTPLCTAEENKACDDLKKFLLSNGAKKSELNIFDEY